jgi:uncharacterized membrane protein YphA (DoxX/SURF4 family)
MKKYITQFMIGTSMPNQRFANIIWLLFRLHIGLSIAIGAGLPKMKDGLAPEWFVKQVADIGFTFISPTFWATIASWGEFVGGICIAIGFLTRFNALQLAFQFFVISFIWYDHPIPFVGMYVQQLFFFCYLLVAAFGGGTFSLDYLIFKKLNLNLKLFNSKLGLLLLISIISFSACAQKKPLRGSGILITNQYSFKNFNEIEIIDLDGNVNVTIADSFSIKTAIDDNLADLLTIEIKNKTLRVVFKNNWSNRKYIEDTKIKIDITLPSLNYVKNNGNNTITINDLKENELTVISKGNGNCILNGRVEKLQLTCNGNGTLNAKNVIATLCESADVMGNGNLSINTNNNFNASVSGNGNIINYGSGKAIIISQTGNGEISYKKE